MRGTVVQKRTPEHVILERGIWKPRWMVKKFEDARAHELYLKAFWEKVKRFRQGLLDPSLFNFEHELSQKYAYAVSVFHDNGLANTGINEMWTLICGTGATKFDNSNAYLGVGDDDTAFAAGQTDLQAETNKVRQAMESGYPTYGSNQKATFKSSFNGDTANFAWNEFATFNAASAAIMMNRKVEAEGTKTSGQVWELTEEVSLS